MTEQWIFCFVNESEIDKTAVKINSRAATGVKNLWATNIFGPKKRMHFWKVHYLALRNK